MGFFGLYLNRFIPLFSKDALQRSKVTVKTNCTNFILNKSCSVELHIQSWEKVKCKNTVFIKILNRTVSISNVNQISIECFLKDLMRLKTGVKAAEKKIIPTPNFWMPVCSYNCYTEMFKI